MTTYRKDIDGLRALAVLPVVFYHGGFSVISGGFVGVDIFFVISGFLITSIIWNQSQSGKFSILHFYERRARRILPALFVVLLFCLAVAWFLVLPGEYVDLSESAIAALLFVSNFYFWQELDYFTLDADFWPLLHTWSLAVEEQFYIFFPPLLMLIAALPARWVSRFFVAALLGTFAFSILVVAYKPVAAFYLLPARAWELLIGSVLAIGFVPNWKTQISREAAAAAGLGLILFAVFTYSSETTFPGLAALPPCLGAALIIHAGLSGQTFVAGMLSTRVLVFIGLISYSLYLWHWPLLAFGRIFYGSPHLPVGVPSALIVLSFVMAYLSWRYVEQPFRSPQRFDRRFIFSASGAGAFGLIGLCAGVVFMGGLSFRLPDASMRIAAEFEEMTRHSANQCPRIEGRPAGQCLIGTGTDTPKAVLWGDSHAGALIPGFDESAKQAGFSIYAATKQTCPPLLGMRRADQYDWQDCVDFNESMRAYIAESNGQIDTVILVARWVLNATGEKPKGEGGGNADLSPLPGTDIAGASRLQVFEQALTRTIGTLHGYGVNVVILGPLPEIGWHVPRTKILEARYNITLQSVPSREEVETRIAGTETVLKAVAERTGSEYVPLMPYLCDPECAVMKEDKLLFQDDDHLSAYGARLVAPQLPFWQNMRNASGL